MPYQDFHRARIGCFVEGGDLPSVANSEEQEFLQNLYTGATGMNLTWIRGNGGEALFWIGLKREKPKSPTFVYTDKAPLNFTYWGEGEPRGGVDLERECVGVGLEGM